MSVRSGVQTSLSNDDLVQISQDAVAYARGMGATQAEAAAERSHGFSVTVRLEEVETVEHNRDKNLVVSVYFGHRSGSASTSDFSRDAIENAVRAAASIAKYTAEDEYSGLAEAHMMAREFPDLDLFHPWSIDVDKAIRLATVCEQSARDADARISNSEGATVATHAAGGAYANSHGFAGFQEGTRHSVSCSVIGESDGAMQRDYWYTVARASDALESAESVGRNAAQRTVRRLDARRLETRQCPVLYEAPVAGSLLSHFAGAVRGSNLYRKASFLLDKKGEQVFSPGVRIHEIPKLPRGIGSASFDIEGVETRDRELVVGGILQSYVLDAYSARKLQMETTGNAGGVRNLTLDPWGDDFEALLKRMDTGLLVTELIGSGINIVTGDYSRGAAGFWVENGEIQYPVEELTVAGNLGEMFRGIAGIGTDMDTRGNLRTGSILIENMTVAGS